MKYWIKSFVFGGGLPVTFLVIVLFARFILRKRRLGNVLAVIFLLLISLLVLPEISGWMMGPLLHKAAALDTADCLTNPLCQAPAIVIPSSGINKAGWLTESTWWRVRKGVELWKAGKAPLLVFTGARRGPSYEFTEAETMAQAAKNLGVPENQILAENNGDNTHHNATATYALLQPLGIRKILLVTTHLHLPRANATFRKAGFETIPIGAEPWEKVTYPLGDLPPSWLSAYAVETILNEYLGYAAYAMMGWL